MALAAHDLELKKCTGGVSGTFHLTAYVVPQGKAGHVMSVGVATSSKEGDGKADCLVDVIKKMKMPSPGSYAAKVSFGL
jgi:hypothetical protein